MSQITKTDLLAPFEVWEVMLDNSTIKFFKPLVLKPERLPHDPDDLGNEEYWIIDVPELMISTVGTERQKIQSGVLSDIRDSWKYVVALSDDCLSPRGRKIKQNYLALAEEIFDE